MALQLLNYVVCVFFVNTWQETSSHNIGEEASVLDVDDFQTVTIENRLGCDIYVKQFEQNEQNEQNGSELISLQEHLIGQTANPYVTRIRGAPCKRRMKNGMETYKKVRIPMQDSTNEGNQAGRQQRKCLLCGKPGHYQKKCPNGKE